MQFPVLPHKDFFKGCAIPGSQLVRTSDWVSSHTGPEWTVQTACTNGTYQIQGCNSAACSPSTHPAPATASTGLRNEFEKWISEHDLFAETLERIYQETNSENLTCDVRIFKLDQGSGETLTHYLVVPRTPVTLVDHAGESHTLCGVEAGVVLSALALLETYEQFGTTGTTLYQIYGEPQTHYYVQTVSDLYCSAAHQYESGAKLLD